MWYLLGCEWYCRTTSNLVVFVPKRKITQHCQSTRKEERVPVIESLRYKVKFSELMSLPKSIVNVRGTLMDVTGIADS